MLSGKPAYSVASNRCTRKLSSSCTSTCAPRVTSTHKYRYSPFSERVKTSAPAVQVPDDGGPLMQPRDRQRPLQTGESERPDAAVGLAAAEEEARTVAMRTKELELEVRTGGARAMQLWIWSRCITSRHVLSRYVASYRMTCVLSLWSAC